MRYSLKGPPIGWEEITADEVEYMSALGIPIKAGSPPARDADRSMLYFAPVWAVRVFREWIDGGILPPHSGSLYNTPPRDLERFMLFRKVITAAMESSDKEFGISALAIYRLNGEEAVLQACEAARRK